MQKNDLSICIAFQTRMQWMALRQCCCKPVQLNNLLNLNMKYNNHKNKLHISSCIYFYEKIIVFPEARRLHLGYSENLLYELAAP